MPSAFPMSSFTVAGKLRKSRLADPTQCNGFSLAAGTRRPDDYPCSGIFRQQQAALPPEWTSSARRRPQRAASRRRTSAQGNGPQHSGFEFGDAAVHLRRPRGFGLLVHFSVGLLVHFSVKTLQQRPGEGCAGLSRKCERGLQNLGGVAFNSPILPAGTPPTNRVAP